MAEDDPAAASSLRERLRPRRLAGAWVDSSRAIGRAEYVASGVALMVVKYVLDGAVVYLATGALWGPVSYLDPRFLARFPDGIRIPSWSFLALALLALPFLWLGITLSARRAMDAGLSGWLGLLFCVPFVNYVLMLSLAAVPTAGSEGEATGRVEPRARWPESGLFAASLAVLPALATLAFSVLLWETYGWTLFVATPFVMGLVAAYLYARASSRSAAECVRVAMLALAIGASALLLLGLEGLLCIVMALPPALLLALLGGLFGHLLAGSRRQRFSHLSVVLLLPLLAATEVRTEPGRREVLTAIDVDAAPAEVWPHVVSFPELAPPRRLPFRLGIAYPVRARIEGEGVGAMRTCEFSTGAYLEPITAWDEPRRLAFDVASQAPPMRELSPYRQLAAPHLVDSLVVERGELRLVATAGGGTRLEGRTWYRLHLFPQLYWTAWSDRLIRAIHLRVLEHVRELAEDPAAGEGT